MAFKGLNGIFLYHIPNLHDTELEHIHKNHLKQVTIVDCPLTDASIKSFNTFSKCDTVTLSHTQITDRFLSDLQMMKLMSLTLIDTPITDIGLKALAKQNQLDSLSLQGAQISDDGLKSLYGFTSLHSLELVRCPRLTIKGIMELKRHHTFASLNCDPLY